MHRVVTHDEFARYELAEDLTGHHHHLVCSNCGRVEDLPASESIERSVEAAVAQAARKVGFRTAPAPSRSGRHVRRLFVKPRSS